VEELEGTAGASSATKLVESASYRRKLQRHHDVILACGAVINTEYDSLPDNAEQSIMDAFQQLPIAEGATKRKRHLLARPDFLSSDEDEGESEANPPVDTHAAVVSLITARDEALIAEIDTAARQEHLARQQAEEEKQRKVIGAEHKVIGVLPPCCSHIECHTRLSMPLCPCIFLPTLLYTLLCAA
jgi:hypothetical protein